MRRKLDFKKETSLTYDLQHLSEVGFVRKVFFRNEMDSTNDLGQEILRSGTLDSPALVLCENQRAGRGRGENHWQTASGSLACSILLPRDRREIIPVTLLSLAAGFSIARTILATQSDLDVGIKWPNDVLIGQHKVAGVLIESNAVGTIVGLGINVNNLVEFESATSLTNELQQQIDLHSFLVDLLAHFSRTLTTVQEQSENFIERCQANMKWLGQSIELTTLQGRVKGIFKGLNEAGGLVLQTDEGDMSIFSATEVRRSRG